MKRIYVKAVSQLVVLTVFASFLSGCGEPPDKLIETASGKPEAVFRNTNPAAVANKFVGICAKFAGQVDTATNHQVICRKSLAEIDQTESVMTQLLIGNSYSTTPDSVMTFTIVDIGNDVMVYADQYSETIMAFGQPKRVNTMGNANFNIVMKLFKFLGADTSI